MVKDEQRKGGEETYPLSKPYFDVSGKAYIVTGGTHGIGYISAREIIKAGARGVLINGRHRHAGEKAVSDLRAVAKESQKSSDCKVEFVEGDVSDVQDCHNIVRRAIEVFQTVDGMVHSGATTERGSLEDTTVELWDREMNSNVRSTFLLTQALSKHMKDEQIKGSIVNISSITSLGGKVKTSTYAITKAAVNAATKIHAHELLPHAIRVNAILVGKTVSDREDTIAEKEMGTEQWIIEADKSARIGRILRAEDIAATVGFLLSDQSLMITGALIDQHPEYVHGCLG